jgi:cysteine dioxygenase
MPQRLEIGKWVEQLASIAPREFTLERVGDFVRANQIQPETLAQYLFYAKSHYTRNLIFKCDLFEVMAICWEIGLLSSIHNHRGQNCWMAVPIGKLRVQNFHVDNRDSSRRTCRLAPTDFYDMDAEHPGIVQPEEPVHQVLNLPEFGQRATSIHIYSKPYDSCEIYHHEKGVYSDAPLHYSSEYGQLSPTEKLF